jgi:hypothetical protein
MSLNKGDLAMVQIGSEDLDLELETPRFDLNALAHIPKDDLADWINERREEDLKLIHDGILKNLCGSDMRSAMYMYWTLRTGKCKFLPALPTSKAAIAEWNAAACQWMLLKGKRIRPTAKERPLINDAFRAVASLVARITKLHGICVVQEPKKSVSTRREVNWRYHSDERRHVDGTTCRVCRVLPDDLRRERTT